MDLSKLPRTVEFVRASEGNSGFPDGFPVLVLLNQTKLPKSEVFAYVTDWLEAIDCIKSLVVRGAPAIGIAGAAAVALRVFELAADESSSKSSEPEFYEVAIKEAASAIKNARPTAVNLAWAVNACVDITVEELSCANDLKIVADRLFEYVNELIVADENTCRSIGRNGAALLPDNCTILTHCNAGSLATAFYGTALGVVYSVAEEGKLKRVYADETRPVGQGARLTVWELSRAGIPVTLICDDMAASVLSKGIVDAVVVGADRIAANGDVANKIGTLGVAVMAAHFGIPFYVAAPNSSIDLSMATGSCIPIEERASSEIISEMMEGVDVYNPAFDITPAELITGIITEKGVFEPALIADSINLQA